MVPNISFNKETVKQIKHNEIPGLVSGSIIVVDDKHFVLVDINGFIIMPDENWLEYLMRDYKKIEDDSKILLIIDDLTQKWVYKRYGISYKSESNWNFSKLKKLPNVDGKIIVSINKRPPIGISFKKLEDYSDEHLIDLYHKITYGDNSMFNSTQIADEILNRMDYANDKINYTQNKNCVNISNQYK